MLRRLCLTLLPVVALSAGCTSVEPYEEQIRELKWRLDSAEQAAEQATVDKRLAEREVGLARKENRVVSERLALAYDALREARAQMDETLHDRLTELSHAGGGPQGLSISQYGGVVLESGILFAPGRHELTRAGQTALTPFVDTLLKPEYAEYDIELAGHTDADPIKNSKDRYRDNHDLASMRANSVRRFLIERGVPEERVYLASWGPNHPIDPAQKARNRRVEVVLRKRAAPGEAPVAAETGEEALPASAGRAE